LIEAFQKVRRGDVELEGLLPATQVQAACAEAEYHDQARLYTAPVTVQAFLGQMLRADRSCQQTVAGVSAYRVANGRSPCSADTGAYCKARQRVPEQVFRTLLKQSGREAESQAPEAWLWCGRRVRVADGSIVQIADTEANRREYPLQRGLEPGCHYPLVRILVIFSLAVGLVVDGLMRPYQGKATGETAMLRQLADHFLPGDVVLGDRYFAGWWDIAWWRRRKIDIVTRLPASRRGDFRRGQRLGKNDHLVTWRRTPRPDWLTAEEAKEFPKSLTLREVRVNVETPGFRTKQVTVATTLLDPEIFSASQLSELYRRRWQAELNLRSLKTHMEMDYLRTKHSETVRKEFAMHLLAYNLVRRVAMEAALSSDTEPWHISFKGTLQTLNEFLARFHQTEHVVQWVEAWLATLAQIQVGHRPDRIEPYALKRRPKDYPPLQEPRHRYKTRLRHNA
jgi:putative transposase